MINLQKSRPTDEETARANWRALDEFADVAAIAAAGAELEKERAQNAREAERAELRRRRAKMTPRELFADLAERSAKRSPEFAAKCRQMANA